MMQSSVEYGSMQPMIKQKKKSSTCTTTRWIIAFMLVVAGAVSYYYFYYVPTAVSSIPIVNNNVATHAFVVADNKKEEIEQENRERITIEYSYEELMAYSDNMSPGSPDWKQFHEELISESNLADPSEYIIQFAVSDPETKRVITSDWGSTACTPCTYGCCTYSAACIYNWGKSRPGKCDYRAVLKPTKAPRTKPPKPTKAPRTKPPKPTKAPKTPKPARTPKPKPTKNPTTPAPTTVSGLSCFTTLNYKYSADGPTQMGIVRDTACVYDIRTGCASMYTGDYSNSYSGGWGVQGFWEFDKKYDEICAAGSRHSNFQVQARCCKDGYGNNFFGGKYGALTDTYGATKVTSSSQYCATKSSSHTLEADHHQAYIGCTAWGDMVQSGGSTAWGGPIDPGFGGVRRLDDGSCQAQTWSSRATSPCTNQGCLTAAEDSNSKEAIIYIDHDDILYFQSISDESDDANREYQKTLIENAGYNAQDETVTFIWKVISDNKNDDAFKVNCGWGPPPVRYSQGWGVNAIKINTCEGDYCWSCTNHDASHSSYDKSIGAYESVSGCPDGTALTDCNGYIESQIDECTGTKGTFHNLWGTYFDGDLCKARADTSNVRAQAVCCVLH